MIFIMIHCGNYVDTSWTNLCLLRIHDKQVMNMNLRLIIFSCWFLINWEKMQCRPTEGSRPGICLEGSYNQMTRVFFLETCFQQSFEKCFTTHLSTFIIPFIYCIYIFTSSWSRINVMCFSVRLKYFPSALIRCHQATPTWPSCFTSKGW
jgi:hypothetical protein